MGSPYTSQAISGYNSNPPPDDGSTGSNNEVDWAFVKTKIGDPIKTLSEAINTAVSSALGKVLGGVGVTSTAVDYTVLSADQGKLVRATASGITITTPDATNVGAPFVFAVLNNSSGTITFDGSGSQTIDGNANISLPAGTGSVIFTDGSNWFTTGIQGTFVGKQMQYGDIINGTIVESNGTNAVTYSLKTLAGADPSATDPVLVCFRSSTLTSGVYVYRNITSATSLTISAGSNLGVSTNSQPFRVWIVLFDDAGTIRMGAIQCRSGTNIYPLGRHKRASSTAEGGAGAADSAQVFYTGTAVTNKAYVILGYCNYESGLSTAGNWSVSPDVIQLFGRGDMLPGQEIQRIRNSTGAAATGSTTIPLDDTIPQNTEGDQYLTQAITPVSASNILEITTQLQWASSGGSVGVVVIALFQDSAADALAAATGFEGTSNTMMPPLQLEHSMLAATSSATTFNVRAGDSAVAGTLTINGFSGARKYGGVLNSYIKIKEVVA